MIKLNIMNYCKPRTAVLNLLFLIILVSNPQVLYSQKIIDSLVNLSNIKFDKLLITPSTNTVSDSNTNKAILHRIKYCKSMSDQLLVYYLNNNIRLGSENKMEFVDSLINYSLNKPYLYLNLLGIKSELLFQLQSPDSTKLTTYNNIEKMDKFINDVTWIQYTNYVNKGRLYLKLNDKPKAEDYFIKALKLPFYQYESNEDIYRFRKVYVDAAIGRIKCKEGDFKELNQLIFVPSALPYICPTLELYIRGVGGECEMCKPYHNFLKN
jgi:tetratricopeptide (TPR) repeat protein